MTAFETVDPKVRFPELEEQILAWWGEADVFRRSLEQREGSPTWIFYEGPPTANGKPGIHHVEAAHVQGRLSAVQDDDRSPRAPEGRLGLPRTAGRDRGREADRDDREEGHRGVRRGRVQPAVPRVGVPLRRGVRTPHATDRLLDRHVRRLPDDGHGLHRVGVVVAEGAPSPRVVGRRPQGHGVLPALRHGPVRRGGRARLCADGRPERVRPTAGRGGAGSLARRRLARDLDDDAVDAPVEHRCRRGRGGRLRRGRDRRRTAGARRVAPAGRPGRGRRGPSDPSWRGAGRRALRAAVPERRGRAHGGRRRLRHPRGRHGDRPPGAGVRRRGPGGRQGQRLAGLAAGRRRRPVHGSRAGVRARRLRQGRGSADRRGPARARHPRQGRGLRARVPLLLAVLDAAPVLRAARLVRPHHGREGPLARGERIRAMGPRAHPRRPVRQLAREQRRLGAVARALLGHAAADLAVRERPRDRGRFAHGARRARRPRRHRRRSASTGDRRGDDPLSYRAGRRPRASPR